jgi:hypothetical protein
VLEEPIASGSAAKQKVKYLQEGTSAVYQRRVLHFILDTL